MAELKTPNGLIVGLIPDAQPATGENVSEPEKPVTIEKPARGRKPKE